MVLKPILLYQHPGEADKKGCSAIFSLILCEYINCSVDVNLWSSLLEWAMLEETKGLHYSMRVDKDRFEGLGLALFLHWHKDHMSVHFDPMIGKDTFEGLGLALFRHWYKAHMSVHFDHFFSVASSSVPIDATLRSIEASLP